MSELIFIEGVSGVGKTTMIHSVTKRLCADGYNVRSYVEFDCTNPIDFYCTAYVPLGEYEKLCGEHAAQQESIRRHSVFAGDAVLIRYYNEDTPLFSEPLLSKLEGMEFCYHPTRLVPIKKYTDAYKTVWSHFVANMDSGTDYFIFDGSLLHHPINDIMRNYQASAEQITTHIRSLADTLAETAWRVFYLETDDIAEQLARAHRDRGQRSPTQEELAFWRARHVHDLNALKSVIPWYRIVNIPNGKWESALGEIILSLK